MINSEVLSYSANEYALRLCSEATYLAMALWTSASGVAIRGVADSHYFHDVNPQSASPRIARREVP